MVTRAGSSRPTAVMALLRRTHIRVMRFANGAERTLELRRVTQSR
jgi:hypothetical protein